MPMIAADPRWEQLDAMQAALDAEPVIGPSPRRLVDTSTWGPQASTWVYGVAGSDTSVPSTPSVNDASASTTDRQLTVAAENSPLRVIYGEVRVGALIANVLAWNSYLVIQCLWGQTCVGVQSIEMNNEALPASATVTHYDGTQASYDATLHSAFGAQSPTVDYTDVLSGVCYSVIKIPAADVTGGLAFNAVVRGRSVYDPRDTTWRYSTNPSLILADFLTNSTYGYGRTVDWSSVSTAANWNDELLSGEVRRRLDGWTIESVTPVASVCDALRVYSGCFLRRRGATFYLVPDKLTDSSATFSHTAGQIHAIGTFEKKDAGSLPTVVEVLYTDTTSKPHRERPAVASLLGVGTTLPRRVSTVRLNGIQRYSQARREAIERLNKMTLYDLAGDVTVFDDGLALEAGDVATFTLPNGISGKQFRLSAPPDAAGPGLWRLSLVEYDPSAYSNVVETTPTFPDTTLPDPSSPPTPTVTVTEELFRTESGVYVTRARIDFSVATFIWTRHYEVELWNGDELVDSGTTLQSTYASPPVQEGTSYTAKVRVVSTIGAVSAWALDTFTAIGKYLPPGDVSSISGFEVGGDLYLVWSAAIDLDVWRYELRYSTTSGSWESATLLDRVDSLRYVSKGVISPGTRRIWVKAIDSVGNYSANAAYVDIVVTVDPDALQIQYYPDAPTLTNMANFVERDGSSYDVTVVGTSGFSTTFGSALSNYSLPIAAYWGGGGTSTSSWEGDGDDPWGAAFTGDWDLDATYAVLGTGSATQKLRLGTNGTNFTDYDPPAKATARYARALFYTTQCVRVERGSIRVFANAQTQTEYGAASVSSTGTPGARVYLSGHYYTRRNILLTPVGNGSTAVSAVADNISLSVGTATNYFDIYSFNAAGSRVAATVDWRFEGI